MQGDEQDVDPAFNYAGGRIGGPPGHEAQFFGWDRGDAALQPVATTRVVPNTTCDVMSNQVGNEWPSDYSYKIFHANVQGRTSFVFDPIGDFLLLHGVIDTNRTCSAIWSSSVATATSTSRRTTSRGRTTCGSWTGAGPCWRTRASSRSPSPTRTAPRPALPTSSTSWSAPARSRSARTAPSGGRQRARERDAPDRSHPRTAPRRRDPGRGDVDVKWDAQDNDGDRTTATLEYSRDDGQSWVPLASGLNTGSFTVAANTIPGTRIESASRFRVIVSDGVLTDVATSGPIAVADHSPRLVIPSPENGRSFAARQLVTFEGRAEDLEDGTLSSPTELTWTSSRDGVPGTGALIHRKLSIGAHVVTLTAVDSSGNAVTKALNINVAAKPVDGRPRRCRWRTSVLGASTYSQAQVLGGLLTSSGVLSLRPQVSDVGSGVARVTLDGADLPATGNFAVTLPPGVSQHTLVVVDNGELDKPGVSSRLRPREH